jgi:uncharacterized protein
VWAEKLLARYLEGESLRIVLEHSRLVAAFALDVSGRLGIAADDRVFIQEASLLHDIGVSQVSAPKLGLHGDYPYIVHGVLGRAILEKEGYPLHALVCERHIGAGLTVADIMNQNLPLPHRDMSPLSLPEQVICFADLFYSKNPAKLDHKKSVAKVRANLTAFGEEKLLIFDDWMRRFSA